MKIQTPSYYPSFCCAAGSCPDTCCRSWEVVVDEETRRRYASLPGPLGDRVRACLRRDVDGDAYLSFGEEDCPMLEKSRLCSLQREFGETALSAVCSRYPRFTYAFGSLTQQGISLSCPEACRLILETPFSILEEVKDAPPSLNDLDAAWYYAVLRGRALAFAMAEDARFSVRQRAALILAFAAELEASESPDAVLQAWCGSDLWAQKMPRPVRRGDFSRLLAVFETMEPLRREDFRRLSALKGGKTTLPEQEDMRLLQYFLYKYFLQAAYDGRLLKKVQFCVSSLLLCEALCAAAPSETQAERIDLLHRYSRETEHSEENLRTFYAWAGRRRQKLLLALLLRD